MFQFCSGLKRKTAAGLRGAEEADDDGRGAVNEEEAGGGTEEEGDGECS